MEELEAELARIQAAPAPLTALRAEGSHLAAVTGGKGAVLGFVTTEDVLSELVGPARPAA
ncbi:hypothetical protein OOK44_28580 [Streptomyces cellulosae]|uniref:hypothetical protein n=1 Tax=Streptomyces cellulosae TaxID=1968 RepID=UPI0022541BD2|nr:hypothetical protein [Streptomyces cellulosae]WTB86368.1 hypothetical protein OG837_00490 [Streptomyces cellulosae]WTC60611.1 hypothetical protein OH715_00590 [Streptomyces cellulosae]